MMASEGKTVLVVDDEESIRNFLTRLLSSLGFSVVSAKDTEAAKGYISEADIVISDMRIGDENGIEFLKHLRDKALTSLFY